MTDPDIIIPIVDGKVVINAETARNLVMLAASHETGPNSFAKVIFSSGEKVTIGPVANAKKNVYEMETDHLRACFRCRDCGQEKCSCPKMGNPNTNWTVQIQPILENKMNDPIKITCAPGRGQFGGYSASINDDHIRAIVERAVALGLFERKEGGFTLGVPGGIEYHSSTTRLEISSPRDPMPEIKFDAPPFDKPAASVDDAVRMAEEYKAEVERLRAELNKQGQAHHEARERFKVEMERQREDVARVRKLASEDAMKLQSERDAANARDEKAKAEYAAAYKSDIHHRRELSAANARVAIQYSRAEDARAAHAEAMECIKLFYGVAVSMSPRKYEEAKAIRLAEALLKRQNKDSSK